MLVFSPPHPPIDEIALALTLMLALPGFQLWKGLMHLPRAAPRSRIRRYFGTISLSALLVAGLMADWIAKGRSLAALGLQFPPSFEGQIGLWLAGLLIATSLVVDEIKLRRFSPEEASALWSRIEPQAGPMIPRTKRELALYVLFALCAGIGWELLYRGFLLFVLTPVLGIVGAVVTASLSYGLAHGFKNRKQLLGSLMSAFIFTVAYAFTHSLWWLMTIHTFIALSIGLGGYRLARRVASEDATRCIAIAS